MRPIRSTEFTLTLPSESQENSIELHDDEPEIVHTMLHFPYNFSYDNDVADNDDPMLVLHTKIFTIADKYDITALCSYASAAFEELALREWNTQAFAHVVDELYSKGPATSSIRDASVRVACAHSKQLLGRIDRHNFFQAVASRHADFSAELARAVVLAAPSPSQMLRNGEYRFKCPLTTCGKSFVMTLASSFVSPLPSLCCPYCNSCHTAEG